MQMIKVKYFMDNGTSIYDRLKFNEDDSESYISEVFCACETMIEEQMGGGVQMITDEFGRFRPLRNFIHIGDIYVDASKVAACRITLEDG